MWAYKFKRILLKEIDMTMFLSMPYCDPTLFALLCILDKAYGYCGCPWIQSVHLESSNDVNLSCPCL